MRILPSTGERPETARVPSKRQGTVFLVSLPKFISEIRLNAIHTDATATTDSPLAPFRDDLFAAFHAHRP
ncbi:hypothetical protein AB9E12_33525, partial [Rhizobium leguminosarum]|uniref:hypothetical protein n=1 Tax=Rhizobium leguminosarum TaxID=384 RepID=UPI003F9BF968